MEFIIIISIWIYLNSPINILTSSEWYSSLALSTLSVWVCHCSFSSSFLYTCHLSLYALSHSQEKTSIRPIFAMSVRLSASSSATTCPSGRISVVFDIGDFYENMSRNSRFVSSRGKNSRRCTWRLKYISLFPATLNHHKWNGKRLLGWPTRDKQCCFKCTFPLSFHHNLLLHSFSFSPLSHTL